MTEDDEVGKGSVGRYGDVPEAANVLLLAPGGSPVEADNCADLLARGGSEDVAVLRIEFGRSAPAFPEEVASRTGSFKVITIGQRSDPGDGTGETIDVTVERVEDPRGLDEIGVRTSETLERWREAYDEVHLCLDSLSALQHHVGRDAAYQFLHVLSRHVSMLDVRAHYHLDPGENDLETTYTYETLVDGIVAGGDVEISPEY